MLASFLVCCSAHGRHGLRGGADCGHSRRHCATYACLKFKNADAGNLFEVLPCEFKWACLRVCVVCVWWGGGRVPSIQMLPSYSHGSPPVPPCTAPHLVGVVHQLQVVVHGFEQHLFVGTTCVWSAGHGAGGQGSSLSPGLSCKAPRTLGP